MNFLRTAATFGLWAWSGTVSAIFVRTETTEAHLLDHLPDDMIELDTLCTNVGLQKACKALSTQPRQSNGYSMLEDVSLGRRESGRGRRALLGIPSLSQTSRTDQNRSVPDLTMSTGEQCLLPGKLIFQHVMKTGGLSLEKFLQCSCAERPSGLCSIRIRANHWGETAQPKGYESQCTPSICSTHSSPTEIDEACGPEFADATMFTTIREPVSRVWSFYNYLRRWYKPYAQYTLKEILQNYSNVNLNEGLYEAEQCLHCHQQLSNAMASHHYAGVAKAYEVLAKMKAIIDLKRIRDFPQISTKLDLFPQHLSLSGSTKCAVEHVKPTKYPLGQHPDPETAELIAQHNREDLMLYKYVQDLPQYES